MQNPINDPRLSKTLDVHFERPADNVIRIDLGRESAPGIFEYSLRGAGRSGADRFRTERRAHPLRQIPGIRQIGRYRRVAAGHFRAVSDRRDFLSCSPIILIKVRENGVVGSPAQCRP